MGTLMSEAMADAVIEAGRQHDKVRDLIRAVRAHTFAVHNPPNGDADSGINAVMTLDRLGALAEEVAKEIGL